MPAFPSPKEAVAAITEMLRAGDWPTLAGYYDLSGTDLDPATLESGAFFLRTEPPPGAHHPGGFWRYRHPFAPGFAYLMTEPGSDPDVVAVTVSITIDQGAGSPAQEGLARFRMRKGADGYRILPD